MTKFVYRMENILNIKYKLEEQAKLEYMVVRRRLQEAEEELGVLKQRKAGYFDFYRKLVAAQLNLLEIEQCKEAIILLDEYIAAQQEVIRAIELELEEAVERMNEAVQERKIHEKLKENQFQVFLEEWNREEMKEIDQMVSYQYNDKMRK